MKNRFIKFASAIALSAMLLTACASAPRGAMVKIGEKYITKDQVQKEYDRVIASYSDEQKAKYDESTEEGKKASLTLKQNILDMFSNIEVVKQKFAKLENFKLGLVKIMIQLMKKLWKNTKVVTLTVHKLMQAIY